MSSASSVALPPRLSRKKLALVHLDISRCTGIIAEMEDESRIVMFFDGFYTLCTEQIEAHGGEVVKYIGDACLASFPEKDCVAAIDAVIAIRDAFPVYCESKGVKPTDVHATIHVGEAIAGTFGPQGYKDVMGLPTGTLFHMARQGISISEQVYRKLPSERRSGWRKHGGQVIYVLK